MNEQTKNPFHFDPAEEPREQLIIDGKPLYEVGRSLTKSKMSEYIERYNQNPEWATEDGQARSILMGKGNILRLLLQPECHGLRIYFGKNEKNEPALIMVGTYKDGKNILKYTLIENGGYLCPRHCDNDD